MVAPSTARTVVLEPADPSNWQRHRFGLADDRWQRLAERSYWITGAGTGFGRAMAVALACSGARVFLTGRRRQKLEETARAAKSVGADQQRCIVLPADITQPAQLDGAVAAIRRTCPALHGLVNNAAMAQPTGSRWPLLEEPLDRWRSIWKLNVTAQLAVTRSILPHMAAGGEVRVLFVTSEAGWAFTRGMGHYNVTKAALNSLAGCLAEECADRFPEADVQINTLVPGEARTEMNQGSTASPFTIASMALLLLSHPPGGPNGKFFHRDGRHLTFAYAAAYDRPLQ